tara:strand:- start:218 stop:853 length:636 start_codon:yes stop_codon:yes gene_type:complete
MIKIIKQSKLFHFIFVFSFLEVNAIEINPVEIGKPYQKDVETNLSIIENLRNPFEKKEIKINKDIRTKKEEKIIINDKKNISKKKVEKNEIKDTKKEKEIKFARIKKENADFNQVQINFESNSANISDVEINKIRDFINKRTSKNNSNYKITSYAKTNKNEDYSRRLSLDRAINIRTILIKEGISAKNLIVKSFGDSKKKVDKAIIEFEKK